jgi:hypothetical protein
MTVLWLLIGYLSRSCFASGVGDLRQDEDFLHIRSRGVCRMKMQIIFRGAVSVAACLVLVGCAADGDPSGDSTNGAVSSTPSLSPTDEPEWRDEYTEAQLAAYEEALDRWMTYEQRSAPIWAAGKATPAARELFEEFFASPLLQAELDRLRLNSENGVEITGVPTVYWSKPSTITKSGLRVDILQCLDFSPVTTTQNGAEVKGNRWKTTPHLLAISLSKPKGYGWLIYSYGDPRGGKKKCDQQGS